MSIKRRYGRKLQSLAANFHQQVSKLDIKPGSPEHNELILLYDSKWESHRRKIMRSGKSLVPDRSALRNYLNLCR